MPDPKSPPPDREVHEKTPAAHQEVRLTPDTTYRAPLSTRECKEDAMLCERCGKAEMYRMHAVWRCPECGFKTDCCGW